MIKEWHEKAWGDYLYWQTQDKKITKKINDMLKSIERGDLPGHAELLKGSLSSWSSSRIDKANRLIYRTKGDSLEIMSCRGHYEQV